MTTQHTTLIFLLYYRLPSTYNRLGIMSASAIQSSIKSALAALPTKFSQARSAGALYFFDSDVKTVDQEGDRFDIRICPALQDKAKATREADEKNGVTSSTADQPKKSSPFEPPYVPELFVGDVPGFDGEEGLAMLVRLPANQR